MALEDDIATLETQANSVVAAVETVKADVAAQTTPITVDVTVGVDRLVTALEGLGYTVTAPADTTPAEPAA